MSVAATIAELEALLQGTGITMLTLTTPEATMTLRRKADQAATLVAAKPGLLVAAPCSGVFLHRHPLRDEPLVQLGQPVEAGAVLGLLRVGPLLLHITAPAAGTVAAISTPEGAVVGYGAALVQLEQA